MPRLAALPPALGLALGIAACSESSGIEYSLTVDLDGHGWNVEMRVPDASDTLRLAMAAHPEYDDQYWRYLTGLTVDGRGRSGAVAREDSAVWRVAGAGGPVVIRYRIQLPAPQPPPRAAWRPFLETTGGLLGGPHAFLYVLGRETTPARVRLVLPEGWDVATALHPTARANEFTARSAAELVESPILVGRLRSWSFSVDEVPHHVVYWPLPDARPFDTIAFVSGIEGMTRQAVSLFRALPYDGYWFLFQDGAYGGLEHAASVTLGAPSADLAENPAAHLPETAHEFVHTWNLMQVRPAEYRGLDYRTQPPVSSLWFSEGLTLFYADLLMRRAGLPLRDSTRVRHLERLLGLYLFNSGNWHHAAEAVSRVAYNAPPGSLGDYAASSHLQGEVIGAMMDLTVRAATGGQRSMDDVMRLMYDHFAGGPGFTGADVERAVTETCACDVAGLFADHVRRGGQPIDFNRYLELVGLKAEVTWAPSLRDGEPERDLRFWGWEPPGEGGVALVVTDPTSVWARAGLHTGDRLVSVDGSGVTTWADLRARLNRLRIGDAVLIEVTRSGQRHRAKVVTAGFQRPTVRIEEIPGATERQRALREAWAGGR